VEATIDFPEEDIEFLEEAQCRDRLRRVIEQLTLIEASANTGRILREGAMLVICGRPNVGKSSLLNALLKANRAIVTPIPGTTRDTIEELVNVRGLPLRLVDTAGLTATDDPIEREGVTRSRAAIQQADLLLIVFDRSAPFSQADRELLAEIRALRNGAAIPALLVLNKDDLGSQINTAEVTTAWGPAPVIAVSAVQGTGLETLETLISEQLLGGQVSISDGALVTNVRHQQALQRAIAACRAGLSSLERRTTIECLAVELREACEHLGGILGLNVSEDLLDRIFKQFCIGK